MNTGAKAAVGVLALMVVVMAILGLSVMGINNSCVSQEAGLEAQYKQNQNSYDKMYKTIVETAGVTDKYSADFRKAYDQMMSGRYGQDGSKAMLQVITESNPQLDSSTYTKLQQVIESSRLSFATEQQSLLDKKRVYESYLGQMPSGLVARMMGFPRKDIKSFDIVTSDRTENTFKTKKDEPMNLGPKETTH